MKTTLAIIHVLLAATISVGTPIDKSQVSSDAKWLLHVDFDRFNSSTIGNYAVELLKAKIKEESKDSPASINVENILNELNAITAYGSTFEDNPQENSVLLVSSGEKLQSIVDAYVINDELTNNGESGIKIVDSMPYTTYLIQEEVYASFPKPRLIIVSKSLNQISKALDVIDGKADDLRRSKTPLAFHSDDGFFLLASVQGLNTLANIPPQARILQKATGAQLSLGEQEENLTSRLTLTTRDETTSSQLARIVEGMVALMSFVELQDASLDELTRSIQVSSGKMHVAIDFSYPFSELTKLFELAQQQSQRDRGGNLERSHFHQDVTDSTGGNELEIRKVDALSDDGNIPYNAIDHDLKTRWSARGSGQWISFELKSNSLIRELQIAWHNGESRIAKFSVETSEDGVTWNRLVNKESSGNSNQFESVNIPDTTTRWIRLKCYGNTSNEWNSIKEVRLLGDMNQVAGSDDGHGG